MSAYEFSPFTSLWHLAAAALVLFGPGLAWLAWTPAGGRDGVQRLADALGVSLAVTSLAGLAAFLAGWQISGPALVALYLAGGAAGLAGVARRWVRRSTQPALDSTLPDNLPDGRRRGWLLVLTILGLAAALAWRLYQVRDLVLPAWVDPLHHVLIVRLILENGGLPASFAPYMPVPFYYHFAFHLSAAVYAFWARLDPAAATLLVGQALNALVALGVYRLGAALWGGWRRAAAAALLVAFAAQMPAYYATWGRYTLLAGLVLLPLAMAAVVEVAREGAGRERVARLALLSAGVLLSHYFAALLLALFFLVQGVLLLTRSGRARALFPLLAAGMAGLALAAPWLARVLAFAGRFASVRVIAPSQSLDEFYFGDYLNYLNFLMGPARNHLLLALGALGLVLAGWQARSRPLSLWTLGLTAIALPWGPQLNPFRPDHAVIVFFLPASLHLADGLVLAWERLRGGWLAWAGGAASAVLLAVLLGWGLRDTRDIINPVTILARAPDLEAIRWIEAHTPPRARFYINAALWQYGHYRGVDGGWWITPLTGRPTLIPPALYAFGPADYTRRVDALGQAAAALEGCTPELEQLLRQAGLEYVYLGLNPGTLRPEQLQGCGFLQPVYQQGGVSIYAYTRCNAPIRCVAPGRSPKFVKIDTQR